MPLLRPWGGGRPSHPRPRERAAIAQTGLLVLLSRAKKLSAWARAAGVDRLVAVHELLRIGHGCGAPGEFVDVGQMRGLLLTMSRQSALGVAA
jgi:hypothetical protein